MKYIDSEKLIAEIERLKDKYPSWQLKLAMDDLCDFITSLQQEQPIEGKQVIIITETDGDANIHWDCRSLDDVMALLTSAKSFIADKQIEELRGQGSGPDYNTVEGRFRNAHKFQQEQPFLRWIHANYSDKPEIRHTPSGEQYLQNGPYMIWLSDLETLPKDGTNLTNPRPVRQPEVDLEKEIEKYLKQYNMLAVGKKDFTDIARHFFELARQKYEK